MAPLVVGDEAICSFGFSFTCFGNPKTKTISHLVITDVQQGSRAESIGLQRGDEIISADGIKVVDFKGGAARGGDLMRLFVNRNRGETIKLVVAIHTALYRITLTARPASSSLGLAP